MCGCCCARENENPLEKTRCCTDIIFLILFVVFCGGMAIVAGFAITKGDAFRLVYGYDSFGNTCNSKNRKFDNFNLSGQDLSNKKNVFFMDLGRPDRAMQICVEKCPDRPLKTEAEVEQFAKDGSKLCRYDIETADYTKQNFGTLGPCPKLPVPKSVSVIHRCVPDIRNTNVSGNITDTVVNFLNNDDIFRRVLGDLYQSWRQILVLCFVALGIALVMVLLLRFMAGIIVWVTVLVSAFGTVLGTCFLWYTYINMRQDSNQRENKKIPLLNVEVSNRKLFLAMAIIATVITVIILLVILVMRKRLLLVVALFKEAGKCLVSVPWLLIQPVWTFIILMLFLAYWLVILAYMATAGDPTADPSRPDFVIFKEREVLRYMFFYHLVGLIWISEFIVACQQLVVAGAVATWYFTRDKSTIYCPIAKSTLRLILHHIGSVAFGAFIITLVKLPRWILMYIESKCSGSENIVAKIILKCCMCCLWCLEKILKFLNRNAYIIVAIEGSNFCVSAAKALKILVGNALRVAAINSVGDFVLFLGKIGVTTCTAAVAVIWLKNMPGLHFYAIPVIIVSLFAYFIAHCFLSIYEMVIDTLLLCFCVDCRDNDGSPGKEYYMSSTLMQFVENTGKALEGKKRLEMQDRTKK